MDMFPRTGKATNDFCPFNALKPLQLLVSLDFMTFLSSQLPQREVSLEIDPLISSYLAYIPDLQIPSSP